MIINNIFCFIILRYSPDAHHKASRILLNKWGPVDFLAYSYVFWPAESENKVRFSEIRGRAEIFTIFRKIWRFSQFYGQPVRGCGFKQNFIYVFWPPESSGNNIFSVNSIVTEIFPIFRKIWRFSRVYGLCKKFCSTWNDFSYVFWPPESSGSHKFSVNSIAAEISPIFRKIWRFLCIYRQPVRGCAFKLDFIHVFWPPQSSGTYVFSVNLIAAGIFRFSGKFEYFTLIYEVRNRFCGTR